MNSEEEKSFSGGIVNLEFTEETLRIFDCPVCFQILWPPILVCTSGHNVCSKCRPKLPVCPVCKEEFSPRRNIDLEDLILRANHSCVNASLGCDVVLPGSKILEHQFVCEFGCLIDCQFCKTDSGLLKLPSVKYVDHLSEVHNVRQDEEQLNESNWKVDYKISPRVSHHPVWYYTIKKTYGHTFFSRVFTKDKLLFWSVGILGNHSDARKFHVLITTSAQVGDHPEPEERNVDLKLTWTTPVHPIRLSNEEVLASGCCGVCPLDFIEEHFTFRNPACDSRLFQTIFEVVQL